MAHTIDSLLTSRCADVGVAADAAIEMARDDGVGTAAYRLPSRVVRRDLTITLAPPAAPVLEADLDTDGVMRTTLGPTADARMAMTREQLKGWYGIASNAEADRRVYEIVAHLLGITEQVDAATGTRLEIGAGIEVIP